MTRMEKLVMWTQNSFVSILLRRDYCFGVSDVELNNGKFEGRRCATFNYLARNLITIAGDEKLIEEDLKRVRGLKTEGQWIEKRDSLTWSFV
jgi:hypothetical protein